MHATITIIAIGLFGMTAYSDVRTRRIPNAISIGVALLGLVRIALAGDGVAATYTLSAGALIFAAAFVLYWRGAIGGGDAKLVGAVALLIGYREVFGFLILMSVFGGVLALVVLAWDPLCHLLNLVWRPARMKSPTATAEAEIATLRPTIPYGVAIAAAGAMTLFSAR